MKEEASRFLIVEDHLMFREIVSMLVKDRLHGEVVAAVEQGCEALAVFESNRPDVVLLDLDLPDMDGMELAEQMMRIDPQMRILAISAQCDDFTLFRVLRSGLFGFVDKTRQTVNELEYAIREVMEWRPFYAASVHQANLSQLADSEAFPKILTAREQEILPLFGVGMRNEEIAVKMGISAQTAQGHRRNVMAKLGVTSTPDLIRYALKTGFARVSLMDTPQR